MVFAKTQFSAVLYCMEKVMRLAAQWYPEFQKRLAERNLAVQFRLHGGSHGRTFFFRDGKVSSLAGIHSDADVVFSFEDAATADRFLSPMKNQMDFAGAAKALQMRVQGEDSDVLWFSGTVNMMLGLNAEDDLGFGKGVRTFRFSALAALALG